MAGVSGQKRRVAVLISSLNIGGFEVKLDVLARHLDRERFDLTVLLVYPGYKAASRHLEAQESLRAFFRWEGVETVELPMRGRFDLGLVGATARILKERSIETLLFMAMGAGTFLGPLVARRAGVSRLLRATDTILDGTYPKSLKIVDRWLLRRTDAVLVPSAFLKGLMEDALKLNPSKIRVVPNGIDLSRFQGLPSPDQARAALGLEEAGPLIGMVANLNAVKRHRLLLEAAPKIFAAVPDAAIAFLGEGPCRGDLEAQAATLGIAHRVHFLGHRTDVPRLLPALNAGVSCSRIETHGISVIEMMAAGVPVVAARVGGIPEIIDTEQTGLLVRSGDVDALAEAVIRVLRDAELRNRLIAQGLDRVREAFDQRHMVTAFEDAMTETA